MVVLDPLEECAGLIELVAVDGRRRRSQIRNALAQLLAHAAPVRHRGTNVVERGTHLRLDRVEHSLLGLAIGFDVDDRLDDGPFARVLDGQERVDAPVFLPVEAHHGVDDEVARIPAAVQDHPHRVDQERHVVGDNLDDGVGRLPAVLLDPGVVDPDLRAARRTPPSEIEMRHRGAVEIARLAFGEVVGRRAGVVAGKERKREIEVLAAHPFARERRHFVDQIGLLCVRLDRHWRSLLVSSGCRDRALSRGARLAATSQTAAAPAVVHSTANDRNRAVLCRTGARHLSPADGQYKPTSADLRVAATPLGPATPDVGWRPARLPSTTRARASES